MTAPSAADLKFAMVALTAVFFVVDPIVAVPIFVSITARDSEPKKRQMAARAALATFLMLTFFALAGGLVFRIFGISLGAFKIAGGLMLLLMAVDMMRAQPSRTRSTEEEQQESAAKEDVAIVPLAIPMLAGPGAIATVMVLTSRADGRLWPMLCVILAILVTSVASFALLRAASRAERFLSHTTIRVLERVMGLILAAVAMEFLVGGLRDMLPILGK